MDNLSVELYQQDWMPGYSAFINNGELERTGKAHVVLNIGSILALVQEKEIEASEVHLIVLECVLKELGHVLGAWAKEEFSLERVDSLIKAYIDKYTKGE